MKKQIIILNILIIILVFSCGQNSSEKKLNGKWYGIENNGFTRMHFHPDSLVLIEWDKESVEWNATESKIEFDYYQINWDSLNDNYDKMTVHYELSKNKDTLFAKFKNSYGEQKLNLLKAKDYIEYLNKRYRIEFSLPEDNSVELIKTDAIYGLKVFMGYSNNKIVGKTELSENLNYLESEIKTFKDSIKPYEQNQIDTHEELLDRRFHLRVFADKNISDSTITKYLPVTIKGTISSINKYLPARFNRTAPDTISIRIYRIYQSEEKEYLGIMKGKKIKTIAKNVYN